MTDMTPDRETNADELQAAHFIEGHLTNDIQAQIIFGLQSGLPAPDAMIRVFAALFPEIELDSDAVLARLRTYIGVLMKARFDEPEDRI